MARFKVAVEATTHRPASDLANKLKGSRHIWEAVGTCHAAMLWCNSKIDNKELLAKTALLGLIGRWGRISNYMYNLVVITHPDDCNFTGHVSSTPYALQQSIPRLRRQTESSHRGFIPASELDRTST